MKHLILIWLACVALAWTALGAPPPSFKSVPNYMVENMCDDFSKDAVRMLHKRGIPAHRVLYGWSMFGGQSGLHAVVLFQWEGKFFFMDNQRMGPRPVAGKTDLGCVDHVTGCFEKFQWMADENGNRRAPWKMADLFAPAPAWLQQLQEGK